MRDIGCTVARVAYCSQAQMGPDDERMYDLLFQFSMMWIARWRIRSAHDSPIPPVLRAASSDAS
jgi:hypothetical protein